MEKSVLSTKIGNKTVGAVHNVNNGTILFLPPVRFEGDEFISFDEESGEEYWTNKAIDFSQRLSSALMEIDNALRKRRSKTPEPLWVKAKAYQFRSEIIAKKNLAKLDERFETLQLTKAELLAHLEKEGNLRALLYEKGYPLENAILEVLNLIGYKAEKYQNGESEFDVVFIDEGIRFLGEVEGRDSQPINIEKLSQLERNIQEDFAREEVEDYAKGVLFGNAYRLIPPEEREDFFTTKCLSGAKRSKISLVRTPDLFRIAKYIKEYGNMSLAKECRKAIESAKGTIAKFPSLPKKSKGKRE